jgi:hypothetical protein
MMMTMKNFASAAFVSLSLLTAACGGGGSKLGVPECDDYLTKMDKCAEKVGGANGDQIKKMKDMISKAWAEDAKNDSMKAELGKTCTAAIADMKKQVPQCDW